MATLDQHGYYRSVVLPLMAEEYGYARASELHYWLKVEHIPPRLWVWIRGQFEPPSSGDLSVRDFSDFLERVLHQAGEDQIYVPPPKGA